MDFASAALNSASLIECLRSLQRLAHGGRLDQSNQKPGLLGKRPAYLDGIEYTIIKNVSTGVMAFAARNFDMTSYYFLQVPVLKDVKNQAPEAICELLPSNVNRNVMLNREAPPFNNPELLRAAALSVDRKAFVDILTEGKGNIGGAMLPPPEGVWGMPPEMLKTLPGYDPDVPKNRAEGRKIMEKLGYGSDKHLAVTVSTRNIPPYRDPAVILIDQLKEIYIDGQLEPIDTAQWLPRLLRKDYTVALNLTAGRRPLSDHGPPDRDVLASECCNFA
jgi:peptide/nickel transport system substrate-binding protein